MEINRLYEYIWCNDSIHWYKIGDLTKLSWCCVNNKIYMVNQFIGNQTLSLLAFLLANASSMCTGRHHFGSSAILYALKQRNLILVCDNLPTLCLVLKIYQDSEHCSTCIDFLHIIYND